MEIRSLKVVKTGNKLRRGSGAGPTGRTSRVNACEQLQWPALGRQTWRRERRAEGAPAPTPRRAHYSKGSGGAGRARDPLKGWGVGVTLARPACRWHQQKTPTSTITGGPGRGRAGPEQETTAGRPFWRAQLANNVM